MVENRSVQRRVKIQVNEVIRYSTADDEWKSEEKGGAGNVDQGELENIELETVKKKK